MEWDVHSQLISMAILRLIVDWPIVDRLLVDLLLRRLLYLSLWEALFLALMESVAFFSTLIASAVNLAILVLISALRNDRSASWTSWGTRLGKRHVKDMEFLEDESSPHYQRLHWLGIIVIQFHWPLEQYPSQSNGTLDSNPCWRGGIASLLLLMIQCAFESNLMYIWCLFFLLSKWRILSRGAHQSVHTCCCYARHHA